MSIIGNPLVIGGNSGGGGGGNVEANKTATLTGGTSVINPSPGYDSMARVTATVANGTAGAPTATKGAVSSHSITVTPSVTNTTGYITGGTITGTGVTVSASELVSGTYNVTSSGTKDVTNYASASVPSQSLPTSTASSATAGYTSKATVSRSTSDQYINIPTGFNNAGAYYKVNAVANGSATPASSITGTGATVSTGTNTLTLSKSVSNTPQVTAGYVSSGTAGNSSVSLTASVTTKAAATITPTTTDQTIASGTYLTGVQTISGDANLAAGNIKNGVTIFNITGNYAGSSVNVESNKAATLTGGTTEVTPSTGYDAMAKVTASVPTFDFSIYDPPEINPNGMLDVNISGSTITVETNDSGFVDANEGITINVPTGSLATPTISNSTGVVTASVQTAGYIGTGSSTQKTLNLTTQAAQTIYPSTSDQTISANRWLTGTQTIKAVTTTNLTADNIKSGVTVQVGDSADSDRVASVTGTYSGGGGGGGLTLIYTLSLGSLSTSSTSASDTGKSLSLASSTSWDDYDVLVIDVSVNTTTNNRHTSTVSMVYLTGTSNVNTKNTYTVGSNKWNSKLSSSGTASTRQSTTAYGIYANSASVSSSTLSIPLYYRYNSNNTGTINGTYTARVYGLKLFDLIGG